MSDPLELESRDTPFPVALAGMIGIAKAIFEAGFGLIGLAAADSVDDPFGGGVFVFGILYLIASILLLRGNRLGYYLTIALSALGLAVAVIYMFGTDEGWSVISAALVSALFNALVLYLLLGRQSTRDFFESGASP
jgi:hypothetical protein